MSIVLPILICSVLIGLFAPRMSARWWLLLAGWIILILAYNFVKAPAVPPH